MSRRIHPDQPLLLDDLRYLYQRGRISEQALMEHGLSQADIRAMVAPPIPGGASISTGPNALSLTPEEWAMVQRARGVEPTPTLTPEGRATVEVPPPAEDEEPPYEEWTNDELRAELVGRGLSVEGKKADLIARLQADDAENN